MRKLNFTALTIGLMFATRVYGVFGGYQNLKASEKLDILWAQVEASEYDELPPYSALNWEGITALLRSFSSLRVSFDRNSDFMPEGRKKVLHPLGSVAKCEFTASPNSPYTGVLKGAKGLIRLSLAGNPDTLGFTPGMAVKFLIDGHPSRNLHVMHSLDGQGKDQNFFRRTFTNIIPEPEGTTLGILANYFALFVDNPFHLGLSHLGKRDAVGVQIANAKSPYQIYFVPTAHSRSLIPTRSAEDFRTNLGKLENNLPLYEVRGKDRKEDSHIVIGTLTLRSRFVASKFGDENLFFRHRDSDY